MNIFTHYICHHNLIKFCAIFFGTFILATADSKAQEKISLQQAVDIALQNNLQIKQAQFNEALSEQDLKQSKLAILPTLNANTNTSLNFGRSVDPTTYQYVNREVTTASGNLSSSVVLFQGFSRMNLIAQNKYLVESNKSYTQKIKNDLVLNVVTTYLSVLNYEDQLTASKQQQILSQQQVERQQNLFDVGNSTLADLSQAKSQLATAELNVTTTQNLYDISMLSLAQLMERDPSKPFLTEKPAVGELGKLNTQYSALEIFTRSVENYPDIKLAEFNTLAAEKAIDVARGNLYPTLSLSGNVSSNYSNQSRTMIGTTFIGDRQIGTTASNEPVYAPSYSTDYKRTPLGTQFNNNLSQYVSLGLNIPIFNAYRSRISLRKAKINYQNYLVTEQLQKNTLNKIISQAVLDLRAAEKNYNSALSAFNSSQDAFNVIQQRFNVGLVNSLDFTQSQTTLNQSEFNLINAKYNLIFRSKVIDYYLGNTITF